MSLEGMSLEGAGDHSWSSHSLPPREAVRTWQDWASKALTPMHIECADEGRFAARWTSSVMGPLSFLTLEATPQRVVHPNGTCKEPSFQLVFCTQSSMMTRIGPRRFCVNPGEFVLLDNTRPYEVSMDDAHKVIDIVMPVAWLDRWLPDPFQFAGRPFSASSKWGLPLGTFLSTIAYELHEAALPRAILADQIAALLALAVGYQRSPKTRHKASLTRRVLHLIEERYGDAEFVPEEAAKTLGISKRYLHALLAENEMTFMGALNAARVARARELLADPRFSQLQIAEISWRCGFLDPSYFARVFRARIGVGPREWRNTQQGYAQAR